jgi:hypothetical protein
MAVTLGVEPSLSAFQAVDFTGLSWLPLLEPDVGIEPTTYCLQDSGSTSELIRRMVATSRVEREFHIYQIWVLPLNYAAIKTKTTQFWVVCKLILKRALFSSHPVQPDHAQARKW